MQDPVLAPEVYIKAVLATYSKLESSNLFIYLSFLLKLFCVFQRLQSAYLKQWKNKANQLPIHFRCQLKSFRR